MSLHRCISVINKLSQTVCLIVNNPNSFCCNRQTRIKMETVKPLNQVILAGSEGLSGNCESMCRNTFLFF